jgi:hypothetical protein
LLEELAETIIVKEGDVDVTVSKQRACIKGLVGAAIRGNTHACAALLALCAKFSIDPESDTHELPADDREILNAFTARDRKRPGTSGD